jgi:hypothetical protein
VTKVIAWINVVADIPDKLEERMQGNNPDVNDQVQAQEEFRAGIEERKWTLTDVEVDEIEPAESQG